MILGEVGNPGMETEIAKFKLGLQRQCSYLEKIAQHCSRSSLEHWKAEQIFPGSRAQGAD